ncbi:MAG: HupE/UreJ family protein [Gammaproteobacteria bacterium]|nr:HupE/UreJ family protein [Gammaproteobacteria bacterium]
MVSRLFWPLAGLMLLAAPLAAHEVRPAYLQITERAPETYDVLFKVPAAGEDLRFGLHLRLPDDVEHLAPARSEFAGRAHVERLRIRRPGGLGGSAIGIDGLSATFTDVLVRIEHLDGSSRTLRLSPDQPSFLFDVGPGGSQVATTYLGLGIEHILVGVDHLLFVLALLLLVDTRKRLLWTITAFTLAHSLTLAAATLGWLTLPPPPVEAVIALSIAFVAGEIVHARQGRPGLGWRQPWLVAFTFGLLHGMGFAGALAEIGLPPGQVPLALVMFNLGVEVGQLLFVAAILLLAQLWRRTRRPLPAWWPQAAAYGIGTIAMFWVWERIAGF